MPNIREYTSEGNLTTDNKSYLAHEAAARRIGPLYNQAGLDQEKIGKLTSQAIDAQKLLFLPDAAGGSGKGGKVGGIGGVGGGRAGGGRALPGYAGGDGGYQEAVSLSSIARDKVVGNPGGFATFPGDTKQSGRGMFTTDTWLQSEQAVGNSQDQTASEAAFAAETKRLQAPDQLGPDYGIGGTYDKGYDLFRNPNDPNSVLPGVRFPTPLSPEPVAGAEQTTLDYLTGLATRGISTLANIGSGSDAPPVYDTSTQLNRPE